MSDSNSIRSVGRALRVLQVVNQHRSLSMMEIARLCALPYPTACRLVETLIEHRMLEREATRKKYRPTSLVRTLSVGYQENDRLADVSRGHIEKLTRDLRWPITVCTRVGMTMMIRESTHAIAPFTLNVYHPGYTMPLLESSSGKVYVAFGGNEVREEIFEHLRRCSPGTGEKVVSKWVEILAEIKSRGYAVHDRVKHTANPGRTSAISVPILLNDTCCGTLTLAFFATAMSLTDATTTFAIRLRETARDIAAEMARHAISPTL